VESITFVDEFSESMKHRAMVTLQIIPLLSTLLLLVAAGPVLSELSERETVSAVSLGVEHRYSFGVDDDADLNLQFFGPSITLELPANFSARFNLLGMRSYGENELGKGTTWGMGLESMLRVMPLGLGRIHPYAEWGLGVLLFPELFLPGGTHYDFLTTVGGGIDGRIFGMLRGHVGFYLSHISNGTGIHRGNPAFDGYSVSVGLRYDNSLPIKIPQLNFVENLNHSGSIWTPSGSLSAILGKQHEFGRSAMRGLLYQPICRSLVALAFFEGGLLDDLFYGDIGLGLVGTTSIGRLAASGVYRNFDNIHLWNAELQGDLFLSDSASLVLLAGVQDQVFGANTWHLATALRVYPNRHLNIDMGVAAPDLSDVTHGSGIELTAEIGWRLSLGWTDNQLYLFAKVDNAKWFQLGLRIDFGAGGDARSRDRQEGYRRLH